MVGEKNVVVRYPGGRAVVDCQPLPIRQRLLGSDEVLFPVIAAVVRDRDSDVAEPFEVGKVGEALIIREDVRVSTSRGCGVGPQTFRRDNVEAVAPVCGPVHEALSRREAPWPGLPDVAELVDEGERPPLGALRANDRVGSERAAATRERRVRGRGGVEVGEPGGAAAGGG